MRKLLVALLLFTTIGLLARHQVGGTIVWDHIGANQYIFTYELVNECNTGTISPPSNETITYPKGAISLTLTASSPQKIYDPFVNSGACTFKIYTYKSDTITLNGPVPSSGWEFNTGNCCLPTRIGNFNTGPNLYVATTMYPDQNGNPPKISTSSLLKSWDGSMNYFSSYTHGKHQFILQSPVYPDVDRVLSRLVPYATGSNSTATFLPGFGYLNPLPNVMQDSANGPFRYDTITGVATYDIQRDDDGIYAYQVEQKVQVETKSGSYRTLAAINHNVYHKLKRGTTIFNPEPRLKTGVARDTIKLNIGDTLRVPFKAVDPGDSVEVSAFGKGFDSTTFQTAGAPVNLFHLSSLNPAGKFVAIDSSQAQVSWAPQAQNFRLGPKNFRLYLRARDKIIPGSHTEYKVITIELNPVVSVATDSINVWSGCRKLLTGQTQSGSIQWSPASVFSDPNQDSTFFTGNQSGWVYARDAANSGFADSIYVNVVDSTQYRLSANNNQLILLDSTERYFGPAVSDWFVNGIPFRTNSDTLNAPASGQYYASKKLDTNCVARTNAVIVSDSGLQVMNLNLMNGLVSPEMPLDSVYGFSFSVLAPAGVNVDISQFNLYGLTGSSGKRSGSGTLYFRIFNTNTGALLFQKDVTVQDPDGSIVEVPISYRAKSRTSYTMAVAADSNLLFKTKTGVTTPYTVQNRFRIEKLFKGDSRSSAPNDATSLIVPMSFNYDLNIGLSEIAADAARNIYPNPVKELVKWDNALATDSKVKVYRLSGALVQQTQLEEGSTSLRLRGLPPGLYLLEIEGVMHKLRVAD